MTEKAPEIKPKPAEFTEAQESLLKNGSIGEIVDKQHIKDWGRDTSYTEAEESMIKNTPVDDVSEHPEAKPQETPKSPGMWERVKNLGNSFVERTQHNFIGDTWAKLEQSGMHFKNVNRIKLYESQYGKAVTGLTEANKKQQAAERTKKIYQSELLKLDLILTNPNTPENVLKARVRERARLVKNAENAELIKNDALRQIEENKKIQHDMEVKQQSIMSKASEKIEKRTEPHREKVNKLRDEHLSLSIKQHILEQKKENLTDQEKNFSAQLESASFPFEKDALQVALKRIRKEIDGANNDINKIQDDLTSVDTKISKVEGRLNKWLGVSGEMKKAAAHTLPPEPEKPASATTPEAAKAGTPAPEKKEEPKPEEKSEAKSDEDSKTDAGKPVDAATDTPDTPPDADKKPEELTDKEKEKQEREDFYKKDISPKEYILKWNSKFKKQFIKLETLEEDAKKSGIADFKKIKGEEMEKLLITYKKNAARYGGNFKKIEAQLMEDIKTMRREFK